ncbi:MAG: InlB B-repeat-containing protein, partial [Spirochaetales bacterium]|nr:InlB B-repeat-containing protein [Spirochaetales bacterium]
MLLKKLESFFLLLVLGFFVFSCDVDNPNQTPTLVNPTPTNNVVSIELLGVDKIEKSRFVFMGTLDENPINIPEDSAGLGIQRIELGATGILEISVNAYSIETGELTATGSGSQEISTSETSFEIQLKPANPVDGFYLTFNNEGEETKFLYYKDEFVDKLPAPKKDGYLFNGWFTMANGQGTKLESNSYKMTADLTVYAYWVATNPDTKYTVTFETNGGSAVAEQIVTAGDVINAPAEPTKTDYIFAGWYFDSSYNTLASFPYSVTNDVTLYAKWVKKSDIVKVTGVTLDKASLSFVSANMSQKLSAIIAPANATNKSVTWTSSNPSVATVSNGTVTALAAGSATITVTTADGGCTATCSVTVASVNPTKTLSVLILTESAASTEEIPAFTATAKYTDRTTEEVTSKATWVSTDTSVATISAGGSMELKAAGKTEVTASYKVDNVTKESNKATVTVSAPVSGLIVYMLSSYGEVQGGGNFYAWKGDSQPYGAWPGAKMEKTTDGNACYFIVDDSSKIEKLIVNGSGGQTPDMALPGDSGHWLLWHNGSAWAWKEYDGTKVGGGGNNSGALTAKVDIEKPLIPEVPTVTISPAASGDISLKGYITVNYEENNAS